MCCQLQNQPLRLIHQRSVSDLLDHEGDMGDGSDGEEQFATMLAEKVRRVGLHHHIVRTSSVRVRR